MVEYFLDTDAASRLMRGDRATLNAMRRSDATSIGISAITQSELLYGAWLRPDKPELMSAVQSFVSRVDVHPWDSAATEAHAAVRARTRQAGRSAGPFDLMIAAQASALGAVLVTRD